MIKITTTMAAAGLAIGGFAATTVWPSLPGGSLPDPEVSTNVSLHASAKTVKSFSLTLSVANPAACEVLVAIGCDSDGDGNLDETETDLVVGCDCGTRYMVDYRRRSITTRIGETVTIPRRDFGKDWNLAKIVKRGSGEIGEQIVETVETMGFTISIR